MKRYPLIRRSSSHQDRFPAPLLRSRFPQGYSGWLVRGLTAWQATGPRGEERALVGAITDYMESRAAGAVEHPDFPAGYTYFGQFIAHDMTFDPATVGQRQTDPDRLHSFRTPTLDLDTVYGGGPFAQEWLYQADRKRLAVYPADQGLPRRSGKALIPDARNDENVILSHLHYSIALLHNMFAKDGDFDAARRRVQWHYQWVILHDYLKRILHPDVYDRLMSIAGSARPETGQLRYYRPQTGAYVPIEFAAAAFRFGHSMIREEYRLNPALTRGLGGEAIPVFLRSDEASKLINVPGTFSIADQGQPDGWDVHWPFFFDYGDGQCQNAMKIDTRLNRRLFGTISSMAEGRPDQRISLAWRDLMIGVSYGLPSGQTLARALGLRKDQIISGFAKVELGKLANKFLKERKASSLDLDVETPLWYYILREAEVQCSGTRLGRLGSEIVGETILGLLLEDNFSFLNLEPRWTPDLGRNGQCDLKDLVVAAL